MKLLFLVGGVAFLLLGLLLCVSAVVVFLMGRKRAAKQPAAMQPAATSGLEAPTQTFAPDPSYVPAAQPEFPANTPWMDPPATPPDLPENAWVETPPLPPVPSWLESTPVHLEPAVPHQAEPPAFQTESPSAGATQAFQLATPPFAPDSTVALPMPAPESWGALHATTGPLAGQSFPVTREGFVIGRDPGSAQVVILDGSVSKRHVWVGVRGEEVLAVDEGSTNGTYLNVIGPRITRQTLTPGDTLIISNDISRLVYQR